MTTLILGITCAAAGFLLVLACKLMAYRKRKAEAALRGCGHLPVVPRNDPLGLTKFWQMLKARREKRTLPWMVAVMDSMGRDVHTAKDTIIGHSFIWTRDIENTRAFLAAQANDFDIGTARQDSLHSVIGSGNFTRTGDAWRESRALLRPQFARDQVSRLGLEEEHFQVMLNVIGESRRGWTSSFDIQLLIFNYAMDVATEFLLEYPPILKWLRPTIDLLTPCFSTTGTLLQLSLASVHYLDAFAGCITQENFKSIAMQFMVTPTDMFRPLLSESKSVSNKE